MPNTQYHGTIQINGILIYNIHKLLSLCHNCSYRHRNLVHKYSLILREYWPVVSEHWTMVHEHWTVVREYYPERNHFLRTTRNMAYLTAVPHHISDTDLSQE